jgi:AcrR family transcriptional regulator
MSTTTPDDWSAEAASSEAPARRGRGRPRDPRTDARITDAAAELMLQRGFDRTTVDDVAALAGVGKATVYRRWPSKEDLAVAAMATLYSAEIPEPDTGSIEGDLTTSYRSVLAFVNTPEGEAFVRTSIVESVRDERIAALYRSTTEQREEYSRRTFLRAIERGEVRADLDVDSAVQWLGGLLALRVITGRPVPSLDDVDALVDFTLRGSLVDPSARPGSPSA